MSCMYTSNTCIFSLYITYAYFRYRLHINMHWYAPVDRLIEEKHYSRLLLLCSMCDKKRPIWGVIGLYPPPPLKKSIEFKGPFKFSSQDESFLFFSLTLPPLPPEIFFCLGSVYLSTICCELVNQAFER